jgi:hypothetical protein
MDYFEKYIGITLPLESLIVKTSGEVSYDKQEFEEAKKTINEELIKNNISEANGYAIYYYPY